MSGIPHEHTHDTCYFDGKCGMCRRSTTFLRRLDWFGNLRFVDFMSLPTHACPFALDDAMRGMPMRTRAGNVLFGFPAVRRALVRTPVGAVPAVLLYIPGVAWVGKKIYETIARNRRRDVCMVHIDSPARIGP